MNPKSQIRRAASFICHPLAEVYLRRDIASKVSQLNRYYMLHETEKVMIRRKKLHDALLHAVHNVPYYRDAFSSKFAVIDKILIDEKYLLDLPLLTKEHICEHKGRLHSQNLDHVKYYHTRTGGTTGEAANIFYDTEAADYSSATTLFCRSHWGVPRWHENTHLVSKQPVSKKTAINFHQIFKNICMNRQNLEVGFLTDDAFIEISKRVINFRPDILHGHPSTIYALANWALESGVDIKSVTKIVETTGELLTSKHRKKIEECFVRPVVNRYGLAEAGVIAYQFPSSQYRKNSLKVLDSEVWLEEIPIDGLSHLGITTFRNKLMPLIRYMPGDLGTVNSDDDGLWLTNLFGRVHDKITIGGKSFLTHYLMDLIDHQIKGVDQWQIVLKEKNDTMLKIKPTNFEDCERLKHAFWETFGPTLKISFCNSDGFLLKGERNKFRFVVNE